MPPRAGSGVAGNCALNNALNFVSFQTVWFAAVIGAAQGHSWLGPIVFGLWALVHFRLSTCRRQDLALLVIAVVAGTLIDSVYQFAGLVEYRGWSLMTALAPLWITVLWANFALALNHSLRWLKGRIIGSVLLGAIGGPISYWAGERLGALEIAQPDWLGLVIIGVVWALITPLLTNSIRHVCFPAIR